MGAARLGTIVLGTVKGDLHDIGKRLVCMLAEGAGFKVIDIGVDQSADSFVAGVPAQDAAATVASADGDHREPRDHREVARRPGTPPLGSARSLSLRDRLNQIEA